MGDAELSGATYDAVAAISSQLRIRFAGSGATDIGFVALATLRHLTRHGPRTVSELAEADKVTTQAISQRLRPLLARGLVTREVDGRDARRTMVRAAPRGHRLVAEAQAEARRALDEAISRLAPGDRTALSAALPALLQLAKHVEDGC